MGLHQRFSFSLHRARRVSFSLAPQEKKKWGRIRTFKKTSSKNTVNKWSHALRASAMQPVF